MKYINTNETLGCLGKKGEFAMTMVDFFPYWIFTSSKDSAYSYMKVHSRENCFYTRTETSAVMKYTRQVGGGKSIMTIFSFFFFVK